MQRHRVYGLVGLLIAIALPLTWWGRQRLVQQDVKPPAIAVFPNSQSRPLTAAPQTLTPADKADISVVIQQQMAAFQANDAGLAFSFASPSIQSQFQTAAQFMVMVQAMYEPVYRPQSVDFGPVELVQGQPIQAVTVLGPDGDWMTAYYQMEQQADNTWRIAGCVLVPVEGATI